MRDSALAELHGESLPGSRCRVSDVGRDRVFSYRFYFLLPEPCVTVGIEGTEATPPPAYGEMAGIVIRVGGFAQPVGQRQEGAEERGAIIVHQLDQSGLLDQTAEFDQLAGACPSVLNPLAGILAGACQIESIALHGQPPKLHFRCLKFR